MKLVKEGSAIWKKNRTCELCGSVFDLDDSNVFYDETYQRTDGKEYDCHWYCGICGVENKFVLYKLDDGRIVVVDDRT